MVEARDRGFQVHVLVNVEHTRHGSFTILNGVKHQAQFQNNRFFYTRLPIIIYCKAIDFVKKVMMVGDGETLFP